MQASTGDPRPYPDGMYRWDHWYAPYNPTPQYLNVFPDPLEGIGETLKNMERLLERTHGGEHTLVDALEALGGVLLRIEETLERIGETLFEGVVEISSRQDG